MRAHRTALALAALAGLAVVALHPGVAPATTITIVNTDGTGEGFNDPTPRSPVAGNPGTTLGAQRLNVFNRAAQIWGSILPSSVQIFVQASFDPMTCSASSGVLGAAGANEVDANFPNAPFANTWYPIALANKLANVDRSPGSDDIQAQFNSELDDNASCLGGVGWYYGYDANEGAAVDLLPVLLHELGHGLGFQTFADLSNGTLLNGQADIFARNIYDRTLAKHWHQMTNAERLTSTTNTRNVIWDGPVTTAATGLALGPPAVIIVTAPVSIAGTYMAGTATFGPPISAARRSGPVVLVDDQVAPNINDGCTTIQNASALAGKIALIDRGNCTFVVKAQQAQAANAIGVIIVNNAAGSTPPGMSGSDPSITIPVLSVTQADGNLIKAHLAEGVQVLMTTDPTQLAGTDGQGHVLLYAPNPVAYGSSISHFDVSCTPNLLMEPSINHDLEAGDVDLTRYLFQDLGWFEGATDAVRGPAVTRLVGNAPNPFNPTTTIYFDLALAGDVDLTLYDLAGRRVKQLAHGPMNAGPHGLRWDGTDSRGRSVAAGVYVARLAAGGNVDARRLVLVK